MRTVIVLIYLLISLPVLSQSQSDSTRKADSIFIAQEIKTLTAGLAQMEESLENLKGAHQAHIDLIAETKDYNNSLKKQIDSLRILKKNGKDPNGQKVDSKQISREIKWREIRLKIDAEELRKSETAYKETESDILKAEAMINRLRQQLKELKEFTGM